MNSESNRGRFAIALAAAFAVAVLIVQGQHEMWRDEMAVWLTVRDSHGFGELLRALEYGGHPALWYICVDLLHVVSSSPIAMQVLSAACIAGAVYLLARFGPFTRTQAVLFACGYLTFYEYGVIARNYGIGVLLAFAFCALYPHRRVRWKSLAVVLFLLAQTSVHGTIIVLALLPLVLFDAIAAQDDVAAMSRPHVGIAVAAALLGVIGAVLLLIPPADSGYATEWYLSWDPRRLAVVTAALRNGLAPLPLPALGAWDTNALHLPAVRWYATAALLLLVLRVVTYLAQRPRALLVFALGFGGTLLFFYVKYFGLVRHHGHLFVILLMALWLAPMVPEAGSWAARLRAQLPSLSAAPMRWVNVLLLLHVVGAASLVSVDWKQPFSRGRDVAQYLSDSALTDMPIVAHNDYGAASVLGYSGIARAYFPQGAREGSFVVWDAARLPVISPVDVVCASLRRSAELQKPVLLLSNHGIPLLDSLSISPMALFDGAMVHDEVFLLSRVDAAKGRGLASCAAR